jgi:hypothetical protein
MPIATKHRPILEKLRREYDILFTDALAYGEWFASHREVSKAIEKLIQFRYNTCPADQDHQVNIAATPWKGEAKKPG